MSESTTGRSEQDSGPATDTAAPVDGVASGDTAAPVDGVASGDTAAPVDGVASPGTVPRIEDEAVAAASTPPRPTLRAWMRDHDDQWPFVVAYLAASVLLSILISLFWLLVVIAVHFVFECVRQSHYREGRSSVLSHALWEVKLDIGLAMLAFAVALYVDVVLGLLGLQSAARVATVARVGARAAAWERNVRTFLLTVDEITRVSHAAYTLGMRRRRSTSPAAMTETPGRPVSGVAAPAWRLRWGWGDRIGVALVSVGLGLILLAPFLTPLGLAEAAAIIREQLRPFPS